MSDTLNILRAALREEPPDIITEVSPNDNMHARAAKGYGRAGRIALESVRLAMLTAGKDRLERILDFGCGHGRILRTLKAAFPDASLTACDINRDGVDFCARVLGATPAYSSTEPADVSIDGGFDLIFSNSFFTHVDRAGWERFLPFLASLLAQDGLLVFTTGGRGTMERFRADPSGGLLWMQAEDVRTGFLADWDRDGFAHRDSPSFEGWGLTVATPSWVCRRLAELGDLRLVGIAESPTIDTYSCVRRGA